MEGSLLFRRAENIPGAGSNKHGGVDGGEMVGLDRVWLTIVQRGYVELPGKVCLKLFILIHT